MPARWDHPASHFGFPGGITLHDVAGARYRLFSLVCSPSMLVLCCFYHTVDSLVCIFVLLEIFPVRVLRRACYTDDVAFLFFLDFDLDSVVDCVITRTSPFPYIDPFALCFQSWLETVFPHVSRF